MADTELHTPAALVNDALSRFGQSGTATLEADDPRQARRLNVYTATLSQASTMHTWDWQRQTIKCTQISKSTDGIAETEPWPNGFNYAFQIPGELISLPETVFSSPGCKTTDYTIEGKRIYGRYDTLIVRGLVNISPEDWPADWRNAFVTLLAANLALGESHDARLKADLEDSALGGATPQRPLGGLFPRLIAQDLAANPPRSKTQDGDPVTNARYQSGHFRNRSWP